MITIRTRQGDTVDLLLWQQLGRNDEEVTDAFWRLNPHAAENGPIFTNGISLKLPDLPKQTIKERIRAWD